MPRMPDQTIHSADDRLASRMLHTETIANVVNAFMGKCQCTLAEPIVSSGRSETEPQRPKQLARSLFD